MNNVLHGTIVVGADGSPEADRAVQWAAEQAVLERRPLVVITAATPTPALVAAGSAAAYLPGPDELLDAARAIAQRGATLAGAHRPGLEVFPVAVTGSPRTVLTEAMEGADLLVLGSRGRGPVLSKLLGSVGASVVRRATCAVVVCRPGTELRVKRGVLVGADGTAESLPVLDFAYRQASLRSQPLTVLHTFVDGLVGVDGPRLVTDPRDEVAERLLLAESVAGFGERYPEVRTELKVARGLAAETLGVIADEHDLVVVGHHATDSLTRRLSSALATAVLERSHTPVAVVPETAATTPLHPSQRTDQ
ncbi:universal stress protein [Nocardioides stalactiti]|uniref:universal stress protein n=1 Tax=Nocardioides stalactiti TaxID=2755356 RepID=UPI001603C767|nr:universal stress protein [Nocardioides stalactiti]